MYSKTNILLIFFLFGCNSSSLTEPSFSDSNFRAEIKMTSYPVLSNYKLFISNTEAYNKVYFDISGTGSNSYTTVIGEIWETSSTYKITTFN